MCFIMLEVDYYMIDMESDWEKRGGGEVPLETDSGLNYGFPSSQGLLSL